MTHPGNVQSISEGSNRVNDEITLRELRLELGFSLRDAELATGISRGVLSEIERGRRMPDLLQLVSLSELYDVEPQAWVPRLEYRIPRPATTPGRVIA